MLKPFVNFFYLINGARFSRKHGTRMQIFFSVFVMKILGLQNMNTSEGFSTEKYLITKHSLWSFIIIYELMGYFWQLLVLLNALVEQPIAEQENIIQMIQCSLQPEGVYIEQAYLLLKPREHYRKKIFILIICIFFTKSILPVRRYTPWKKTENVLSAW